ncbi:NAD(P)/FAD-dependent oxidoreductase [Mycobacterium sp. 4858]|uniref:FAD-dependent oxidoreductase n=1 Tax=Mycobacterium sp. 4858 TaxID=2057185 RepID=UPI000C81CE40|nr:FAD-dependent oxidoreductase [Mycobacterium sp. 4858]
MRSTKPWVGADQQERPASRLGEHAVVLGAGIAGLLAARVLSEFYDSVTVVERDALANDPCGRKGVPQDRHLHNFLGGGTRVLAELFPGLLDEMGAAGAVVVKDGDLSRIYARTGRCELKRSGRLADPAALTLCLASRPFVELHVRRRVGALPNVTITDRHDIVEPIAVADAVTGARIVNRDNGLATTLNADLVIDAMGRAARTPAFLERLGYGRPPEKRSTTALGYSSQRLRIPHGRIVEQLVAVNQGVDRPGALLMACEHDTWMLAVGRPDDQGGAPTDFATMLAVAAEALPRSIADGLHRAEPVGEIATYRNPASVWRRYDRMPKFPRGLLVTGDALCSLNPVYGQGMTMAALQALALRGRLRGGDRDLAKRFFDAAAADIGPTWARNQANDRVPSRAGKRSLRQRPLAAMVNAMLIAAGYDIAVAERLLRVAHLVDQPSRLTDPALLPHVLAANLRHLFVRTRNRASRAPTDVDRSPGALLYRGQQHG